MSGLESERKSHKVTKIITLAIFVIALILIAYVRGFGMSSHVHFIDVDDPKTVTKGQPHKSKYFDGDFFKVSILRPEDHRVKLPLRQMSGISVHNKTDEPITFKIVHWQLADADGRIYKPVIRTGLGEEELGDVLNRVITLRGGAKVRVNAYYNIPKSVKRITIDIEIEFTSPEGGKVIFKKSIPLKQATFRISLLDEFLR